MLEAKNPFLQNLHIAFVSAQKRSVFFGKNESGKESVDWFYRERAEKTSVYKTDAFYNLIPTLKSTSKDLLLYIVFNMKWGEDWIRLDRDKIMGWGRFSLQTYYTALNELVDCGVVCKYRQTKYWINPAYLFKGDRFKYANESGVSMFPYKKEQPNE